MAYFEIPTDQPEKNDLFKTIFCWEFQQYANEDYWMVNTGDDSYREVNGAIMKKT